MDEKPDHELSYGEYLKIPELLSLQECLSDPEAPDELLFIVIHQAYELWFKEILHELDKAKSHLQADELEEATRLVKRVLSIEEVLVDQIHILETMRPTDFLEFRSELEPASGFQSVQFREVEFLTGMKNASLLEGMDFSDEERKRLHRRLDEPSLRVDFYEFLARQGFDVVVPPDREDYPETSRKQTLSAVKQIYAEPGEYPDIYRLCESLVEHDRNIQLWRYHHVRVVERLIGTKMGTGGSEGVEYLNSTLSKRALPMLWEVRGHI
jgi:tryptophan 2,3-dioxygenase